MSQLYEQRALLHFLHIVLLSFSQESLSCEVWFLATCPQKYTTKQRLPQVLEDIQDSHEHGVRKGGGEADDADGRWVTFASVILNSGSFSADKFNAVANATTEVSVGEVRQTCVVPGIANFRRTIQIQLPIVILKRA